jgi:probable rRNA maturation factor
MIVNRQDRIPISIAALNRFWGRVRCELKLGRRDATVCFVGEPEMARLNREFRGKRKSTDVLSFPFAANGNRASRYVDAKHYLGDIAISPAVARRNAKGFGRTVDEEIRVLILHGALHLLGYDHETDDGEMEVRETQLRKRLGLA